MASFNIDTLKPPLKGVYNAQLKWSGENWRETLKKNRKQLHGYLEKIDLFDIWSNKLDSSDATKELVPEIFMDAYMSLHFASMGLYKYANACLRSELETALRLVFFSTHPVEFKWWCEESDWYRAEEKGDVWGKGFNYFDRLESFKNFGRSKKEGEASLFSRIKSIYSALSKYVHSGKKAFQTSLKVSPKYDPTAFKSWSSNFNLIQEYVNVVLVLGFPECFKKMRLHEQTRIVKIGVSNKAYRKKIKQMFELKIRGRL